MSQIRPQWLFQIRPQWLSQMAYKSVEFKRLQRACNFSFVFFYSPKLWSVCFWSVLGTRGIVWFRINPSLEFSFVPFSSLLGYFKYLHHTLTYQALKMHSVLLLPQQPKSNCTSISGLTKTFGPTIRQFFRSI